MPTGTQLCAVCGALLPVPLADVCVACGGNPLLRGAYMLAETVGRGAAGITYRAVEVASGRRVAVKEMAYRHADSVKALELFHREAQVLGQLSHPGIPAYLDHFEAGEGKGRALYLVQEYLDGETLAEEAKKRRYTEREVLEIVDQLLEILGYLHSLSPPVIHRDLKPENVIRRAGDGRLVLIDFGSVRDAVKDPEMGGSTVAGTFGYMAPEQFRGVAEPGTDVYAVGALAVALLSRREPHQLLGPTGQLAWEPHVNVGTRTGELLGSMLAPDVTARPSDIRALRAGVAAAMASPEPATTKTKRARKDRTNRDVRRAERRVRRAMDRSARHAQMQVDPSRRRRSLLGFAIGAWVLISLFVHLPWQIMVGGILAAIFVPKFLERLRGAPRGSDADADDLAEQDDDLDEDREEVTLPESKELADLGEEEVEPASQTVGR